MESIKPLAEIFAFISAGLFFTYKGIAGYFTYNVILSLKSERNPHQNDESLDNLVISTYIEKGSSGTIVIHDAQVRISYTSDESPKIVPLIGIERLNHSNNPRKHKKERKQLDWEHIYAPDPLLGLAPGEKTEFSCFVEIPKNATCAIEVAVLGRGIVNKMLQWRASTVSTPRSNWLATRTE